MPQSIGDAERVAGSRAVHRVQHEVRLREPTVLPRPPQHPRPRPKLVELLARCHDASYSSPWHTWLRFSACSSPYFTSPWLQVAVVPANLGPLPAGVVWFGAIGAVMVSLYGIFLYNQKWDTSYNYWHYCRPLFGAVTGSIGISCIWFCSTWAAQQRHGEPIDVLCGGICVSGSRTSLSCNCCRTSLR